MLRYLVPPQRKVRVPSLYLPLIYHAIFNGTTLAVVKFVPEGAV